MGSVGDCNSVCVADSLDGIVWHKPNLTTGPRPGTNVVFADPPVDTATVWRDERADSEERYKLAIVPTNGTVSELAAAHGYYRLYSSADGITWSLRVNRTGPTEDGDTIFYNPYREKWVWSVKGLSYYSKSLGVASHRARLTGTGSTEKQTICLGRIHSGGLRISYLGTLRSTLITPHLRRPHLVLFHCFLTC